MNHMNLFVGTSGYSYTAWKGSFYPADLPATRMLQYYSTQFRSVEINNTFYRMPRRAVLETWAEHVPPDFRFVLKAPRQITHDKRLKASDEAVAYLLETAWTLKEHLGPLLFQLPPNLKKDMPRLRDFLATLRPPYRAAFEFRHASWFDPEVYELLGDHHAAMCIAQAEDDVEVPFVATAKWGYLRLRRGDYDDEQLSAWAQRIRSQAWQDVFVFFKHEEAGKGPRMAKRFLELAA